MDYQLTPVGAFPFFAADLFETVTRQAGFIVPILLERVTIDSDNRRLGLVPRPRHPGLQIRKRARCGLTVEPITGNKSSGGKLEHQDEWVLVPEIEARARSLPTPVSRLSST
jgi:hypothetical protein